MSTQKQNPARSESEPTTVNEVRLVGRESHQQAEPRRARVRCLVGASPTLGELLGQGRRRGGRGFRAPAVLPRWRCCRVPRGGGDDVGAGRPTRCYPSRRERMSTPTLGLGWKEVAFS